jgi:hypothetical protein
MDQSRYGDSSAGSELTRLEKLTERLIGAAIALDILIWALALLAPMPPPPPKTKPYGCLEAVTTDGDAPAETTAPTPSPT